MVGGVGVWAEGKGVSCDERGLLHRVIRRPDTSPRNGLFQMSYSLNFLEGLYRGFYKGVL